MNPPPRALLAAAGVAVVAIGVLAFLSFGGVSHRGTPRQQLVAWVRANGLGAAIGTLYADNAAINAALAGQGGSGALHTTCGVLLVDSSTATAKLPAPDSALSQLLARAYLLEYQAGDDCYQAGATNRALLARSARERTAAEGRLAQAVALVHARTGAPLPTTTTTSPGGGGPFG